MTTNIVNIGNNKGVILPAHMLQELQLSVKSAVNIFSENGSIVITPAPRRGWEEAAMEMVREGHDDMLIPDVFEDEMQEDWTW